MDAQLARWRRTLADGAHRVVWKLGINARPVQRALGIDGVVLGHLTSATEVPSRGGHSLAGGTRVAMEAEVALHVGVDVPAGASPEEVRRSLTGLGAAIELVDLNRGFDDVEAIVAGNVFHRAVAFGPPVPATPPWLDGVEARIVRNGDVVETLDAATATGDLVEIVRFVADTLGACGERLRAGDRVIAGSLGRLVFVEPEDVVEADLGRLGTVRLRVHA